MINQHRLANELEKQRYRNGKLDDRIKNDLCDALEYGLIPFYNNCYNLSFPVRKAVADAHYDDIRKWRKLYHKGVFYGRQKEQLNPSQILDEIIALTFTRHARLDEKSFSRNQSTRRRKRE